MRIFDNISNTRHQQSFPSGRDNCLRSDGSLPDRVARIDNQFGKLYHDDWEKSVNEVEGCVDGRNAASKGKE